MVFPLFRLTAEEQPAQRRCRRAIRLGFRAFVQFLTSVGLLRCTIRGDVALLSRRGVLVVANHPSLIDAIVLISLVPDAVCVVKEDVWRSPLYGRAVRAAGYVPRLQAVELVDRIASLMLAGQTVLLFPEGTRTPPGEAPVVRRGTALALLRADRPAVPVRLDVSPRVLAKGYSLLRIPAERVRYTVTVHDAVFPTAFDGAGSERANARAGARLLAQVLGGAEKPG